MNKELDNGVILSNVYMNVNEIHVVKHPNISNVHDLHYELRTKFAAYTSREAALNGKAHVHMEHVLALRDTLDPTETIYTQAYNQIKQNYDGVYEIEDVFEN